MKILSRIKWTGLALVMLSVADVDAVVLVYEGFDYSLANNATINGVSATGFGLQGSWAVTNDLPKNGSNSGSAPVSIRPPACHLEPLLPPPRPVRSS